MKHFDNLRLTNPTPQALYTYFHDYAYMPLIRGPFEYIWEEEQNMLFLGGFYE